MGTRAKSIDEASCNSRRCINDDAIKAILNLAAVKDAREVVSNIVSNVANKPLQKYPCFEICKRVITVNNPSVVLRPTDRRAVRNYKVRVWDKPRRASATNNSFDRLRRSLLAILRFGQ